MLTIVTLGELDVRLEGVSLLDGKDAKWGLLPVYLVEAGRPQPRSELARFLWPLVEVETARTNLRTLLMRMRREGMDPYFQANRSSVALVNLQEVDYDCAVLRRLAKERAGATLDALKAAADRYRGDFLDTVALDEYPALDEWAIAVRVEMEIAAVHVLSALVTRGLESGAAAAVRPYAAQLTSLTPFDDAAAELYVRTLAEAGEVAAALLYFQQYQRDLAAEMALEVASPSLLRLVEEISRPRVVRERPQELPAQPPAEPPVQPPAQPQEPAPGSVHFASGHIVGRADARARLEQLLDQGVRLISVTGMGGIGKTAFVHSRLHELSARCDGRLYEVDCRGHAVDAGTAAATLLHTIAVDLRIRLAGDQPVFDQVRAALAGAPACLILDNFETLDAAAPTVAQLVAALPALTVITTTRRALRLRDEAIIELHGLDTRPGGDGWSEAAAFFVQRVRQERTGFALTQTDRQLVESICRRLGGHPLAIELAAAQADFYGLAELREIVGRDATPLAAPYQDAPAEHQSLAALLEGMWSRLSPAAGTVLAQLSVFASAFTREDMQAVAPAGMDVYRELHVTSLLQTETELGWFSLHPLVNQYAAQRLALQGLEDETRARHSRYFLAPFDLGGRIRAPRIFESPQLDRIRRTQADALAAWENAVAREDWALLERVCFDFAVYLYWTQQRNTGARLLALVSESLPAFDQRTPGQHRLAARGAAIFALSHALVSMKESSAWYEHSLASSEAAHEPWDIAATCDLYADSILNHGFGQLARAEQLLARASQLIALHDFTYLAPSVTMLTSILAIHQGAWTQAEAALTTALASMSWSRPLTIRQLTIRRLAMLQAAFLDDWQTVMQLVDMGGTASGDRPIEGAAAAFTNLFQARLLAQRGDLAGACRHRIASMPTFVNFIGELPGAYGELALWQTLSGDVGGARVSADAALARIRPTLPRYSIGFGLLVVGVCHWLWDETARAEELLRQVLTLGLELEHAVMIFSPLYYLVQIHAARLPADLVAHVVQIGAVSPALYFALRPPARSHPAAQELARADDERAALWATDRAAVTALLAEVEGEIGRLRE